MELFLAADLNLELKVSERPTTSKQPCEMKYREDTKHCSLLPEKSPTNSSDKDVGGVFSGIKKERILNAAEALFAEKGFLLPLLKRWLNGRGSARALYMSTGSKDEIFRQTLKAGLESYLEAMKGRPEQPCSVRDVLTAIGTAHFNFVKEHTFTARLLADEYNETWAPVAAGAAGAAHCHVFFLDQTGDSRRGVSAGGSPFGSRGAAGSFKCFVHSSTQWEK